MLVSQTPLWVLNHFWFLSDASTRREACLLVLCPQRLGRSERVGLFVGAMVLRAVTPQ